MVVECWCSDCLWAGRGLGEPAVLEEELSPTLSVLFCGQKERLLVGVIAILYTGVTGFQNAPCVLCIHQNVACKETY